MDKSIVFDTCMQIRHNYDGCKKGMRPSGGRCVPAKGRMAQGNHTGAKIAAGVLGAGALGTAIALPFALGGRKGKGAAVSESPVEQKPVKQGKPLIETTMVPTRGSKERAAETKTTKESGVKAAGRATPLTGRALSEEERETAQEKPRDPSINQSLLNTRGPQSKKEAEARYPQWFKPTSSASEDKPTATGRTLTEEEMELSTANTPKSKKHRSSTFSGKKMARPTRKDSAAQLVFDALSFVLSDRY